MPRLGRAFPAQYRATGQQLSSQHVLSRTGADTTHTTDSAAGTSPRGRVASDITATADADYGLVGSIGAVALASGTVTQGGVQTRRVSPELLVCWAQTNSTGAPTITAGWTLAESFVYSSGAGVNHGAVYVFYKIAAGGDANPTVTLSGEFIYAQLAELSGGALSSPVDQTGASSASTSSPVTATAGSNDTQPNELVVYAGASTLSTAGSGADSVALNNGAAASTSANSNSTTAHYAFGYGITTGNATADAASLTFSTTNIVDAGIVVVTFLLGAGTALRGLTLPRTGADTTHTSDSAVIPAYAPGRTAAETSATSDAVARALTIGTGAANTSLTSDLAIGGLADTQVSASDSSLTSDFANRETALGVVGVDVTFTTDVAYKGSHVGVDHSLTNDATADGPFVLQIGAPPFCMPGDATVQTDVYVAVAETDVTMVRSAHSQKLALVTTTVTAVVAETDVTVVTIQTCVP